MDRANTVCVLLVVFCARCFILRHERHQTYRSNNRPWLVAEMEERAEAFPRTDRGAQTAASAPGRTMAWKRIASIALNTFREAVRDRVLYNLVLFVLLLTGAAVFIGELSGGQERKIIVDLGLSAMLIFGVFIAIFVCVGLVYNEIEMQKVYAKIANPVGTISTSSQISPGDARLTASPLMGGL